MVRDVLYVLGMTKNLISVSTLEDRGYVVSFQDGRVYIGAKDSRTTKVIGAFPKERGANPIVGRAKWMVRCMTHLK
jgi:hypothetical protein